MPNDTVARLKALKLNGMAQSWPELLAKVRLNRLEPDQLLSELIAAETAERELRSLAYQMHAARFPVHRDLAGFVFDDSRVDEALVRRLHQGAFIDTAENMVLIGGPGTGKTHLATAIGVEAVQCNGACASFPPSNWSIPWKWKRLPASRDDSRIAWPMWIW